MQINVALGKALTAFSLRNPVPEPRSIIVFGSIEITFYFSARRTEISFCRKALSSYLVDALLNVVLTLDI